MRTFFSNMPLGVLTIILMAGTLLISVCFLMYGAATGLGTVFVARPWLGWVMTGGIVLSGSIVFFKIHFLKIKKAPLGFSKVSEVLIQKIISATHHADIREWTREHPFQSTGAAAAAGFIAAGKEPFDIIDILKEIIFTNTTNG